MTNVFLLTKTIFVHFKLNIEIVWEKSEETPSTVSI